MAKKEWLREFLAIVVFVALAIVFTLDDATLIGEAIDPAEFIALGIIGYFLRGV